jgi:transcriptional regulator with XRE-family HTH domain
MNQFAVIIGRRLRARRRLMGLTQAAVGKACGLSFQQVHKYESGLMVVSASRLWKLSKALGVPVSYFFEGLPAIPSAVGARPDAAAEVAAPPAARAAK